MLFNSVTYLFIFLPIVVLLHQISPEKLRLWLILSASIIFYAFWRIEFVPLLLFSAALDYALARWIDSKKSRRQRRRIMLISVAVNLVILGIFKYLLFFRDTFWSIAGWLGYHPSFVELNIILPLGISFYIFATISYVIDVYRGDFKAERNFLVYCCFVVFFPHLVAGPILRAGTLIPQLRKPAALQWIDVRIGVSRILQGLFLKVVLADTIAGFVDKGFAKDPSTMSAIDAWTLALLFGFQVYFDFAGYSHIAIGSARLFGIALPENFDFPYLATSPRDFWRRWHISLSNWIRDYVYLSLVGERGSQTDRVWAEPVPGSRVTSEKSSKSPRTFALYGTWVLMGFWHGANWTFALWGLYHAALVHGYRLTNSRVGSWNGRLIDWPTRAVTFLLVMAGWVPFRCQSVSNAVVMWGKMLSPRAYWAFRLAPDSYFLALAITAGMLVVWFVATAIFPLVERLRTRNAFVDPLVLTASVISYAFLIMFDFVFLESKTQFIYFQF
jgi:D-alanyl-lipoteichoic acid acyltransferase DltB (MBOAT superfamily)